MHPFRGLLRNWSATGRLEPRYYWLTSCVGLVGGSLGVGFTLFATNLLARFLGRIIMVRLGKCTATEALHYALFSRYPTSWFRKKSVPNLNAPENS
jgi:hypothetical protein